MKRKIRINVAFKTEMEGRENVMKEMFVFLKALSIDASGVCPLNYYNSSLEFYPCPFPLASRDH